VSVVVGETGAVLYHAEIEGAILIRVEEVR
jgi:hypothetical protein